MVYSNRFETFVDRLSECYLKAYRCPDKFTTLGVFFNIRSVTIDLEFAVAKLGDRID